MSKELIIIKTKDIISEVTSYKSEVLFQKDVVDYNTFFKLFASGLTKIEFDLYQITDLEKLKWLLNANKIIDFDASYSNIEKIHRTEALGIAIEAEIKNPRVVLNLKIDANFKENFNFKNQYENYIHFNKSFFNNPIIIDTALLINNIENNIYTTSQDFFFSIPFFNSVIANSKHDTLTLDFVEILNRTGVKTLAFKATHILNGNETYSYYDLSYKPPRGGGGSVLNTSIYI